jgi:hypothetical protein
LDSPSGCLRPFFVFYEASGDRFIRVSAYPVHDRRSAFGVDPKWAIGLFAGYIVRSYLARHLLFHRLIDFKSTMGIFPIIMNILQFWLVDSIVKASGKFDTKATEQDPDREPLCASPPDDDNGDANHDIENPHPSLHTSNVSHNKVDVIDSTLTQPPTVASGMVIPSDSSSSLQDSHAYPPNSLSSGSSAFSQILGSSPQSKRKLRRSPPPPISVRSFSQPVINSPQRHAESRRPSRFTKLQRDDFADDSSQDLVSSWEDSDDWAERVGEEEWAGKRLTEKTRLEGWDSPVVTLGS